MGVLTLMLAEASRRDGQGELHSRKKRRQKSGEITQRRARWYHRRLRPTRSDPPGPRTARRRARPFPEGRRRGAESIQTSC